ncbi:siderophore ferric iron reductase [Marinomonas sp.]|uniref:siderophore ferric iron reductase n=1 Tax=Marinomonas sp. TaxID=1904862 RepID=UPI003C73A091
METPLPRLFKTAASLIPILDGRMLNTPADRDIGSLSADEPDQALRTLHHALQEAHPEAGAPYWRVRCWGLVCWQPIYLALICVYQLKSVPLNLQALVQNQQATMVAGYQLPDGEWQEGHKEELINTICQSLARLFKTLQHAHMALFGGNPILYQTLLADQLLASLVVAGQLFPAFDEAAINTDFKHWANALALPLTPLKGLQYSPDKKVRFVRQTCCLHFRRCDGALCSNCPRLQAKHAREHKKRQLSA